MNRVIRRIAIAVVSPALVVALGQAAADTRPSHANTTHHTAAPAKVCFLNPVWGDSPCLT